MLTVSTAAPAHGALSAETEAHLDDVVQHLFEGGGADDPVTCEALCQALRSQELDVEPSLGSREQLHRELRMLRGRTYLLHWHWPHQWLRLSPGQKALAVKTGDPGYEKWLRYEVPEGFVEDRDHYFSERLARWSATLDLPYWQFDGPLIRAGDVDPDGAWVWQYYVGCSAGCNTWFGTDADERCEERPPAPRLELGQLRTASINHGGCTGRGTGYYLGKNEFAALSAVEDYIGQPYDYSTLQGWNPSPSEVRELTRTELSTDRYPVVNAWYDFFFGTPGACDPTAPEAECNGPAGTVPDCIELPHDDCVAQLEALGFTRHTREDRLTADVDYSENPDTVLGMTPAPGSRLTTSTTVRLETNPGEAAYAVHFRPVVRFDTSDHWRPLNVELLLGEHEPDTGAALHQVCVDTAENCSPVTNTDVLRSFPDSGSFLNIKGADQSEYRSPAAACNEGVLYDCNGGPATAGYVQVHPTTLDGYRFIEYWWFYRFNDDPDLLGGAAAHEGDWEAVTVAVPPTRAPATFDFATFSQHSPPHFSYLRENTLCDEGGVGSCGAGPAKTGVRINTFVANRSHANYPSSCTSPCFQNHKLGGVAPLPEGSHDGALDWGRNSDVGAFVAFPDSAPWTPSLPGGWTSWPGRWGVPEGTDGNGANGPTSPARQQPFYDPGTWTCADPECSYLPPGDASSTSTRAAAESRACDSWFGGHVAAVLCNQGRLLTALRRTQLGRRGRFTITRVRTGRVAASAPGIAQLMGEPLRTGEEIEVSGAVPRGTELLVRVRHGRRLLAEKFSLPSASLRLKVALDDTGQGLELSTASGRVLSSLAARP